MTTGFIRCLWVCLLLVCMAPAMGDTNAQAAAPGYGDLGYPLPTVGSYQLPTLGRAANGEVLDTDGQPRRLHQLFGDKYVLLAFIYSTCGDVNGCPLSSHVFYQIKSRMKRDPKLAKHLKLISLSFDPEVDTPPVMALYGNNFKYAGNKGEWKFITTASDQQLQPILTGYNQEIQRQTTVDGKNTNSYSHLLRVFLIDPERNIRNIYSVAFLHHELIINDFKTLLAQAEQGDHLKTASPASPNTGNSLSMPGDDKRGYESNNYQTRSRALVNRTGREADLLGMAQRPPLGLPPIPVPADNPLTVEKIALGRKLFYDRRLSLNDTFSCAMCHVPEQGFTSNELAMAVGIEGRSVRRNSPTVYNVAYAKKLFHDGREDRLEQQVWGPLLARNEMANPSVGYVLNKIRRIDDYRGLFEQAFQGRGVSMETVGMALASYQRTLISANSPFDRWHFNGEEEAISESAKQGFRLFTGRAGCVSCHTLSDKHALFTDNKLHNTGIGFNESMGIRPESSRVTIAPGVTIDIKREVIDQVAGTPPSDLGLYEVTQNPSDRWKYKTPTLRNVVLTAPYMHNGSFGSLKDVVAFYNRGGVPNELQSPLIKPLNLTEQEQSQLVAFLETLTGSNVDTLVADAFAAPVGDIKKGDPTWAHGTAMEVQ